ncbi:TetR/AcrR family transcriptional regulator [Chloroflexota bacterium]
MPKQGEGRPSSGLGRRANINDASTNSNTTAIIRNICEMRSFLVHPIKIMIRLYTICVLSSLPSLVPFEPNRHSLYHTQQRTERKKESIRQSALGLFKQYGFDKVSVGAVAEKARVSHVTIYKYFGSKDELVSEIIKTLLLDMMEKYRAIIKGEGNFLEKMF